MDMARKFLQMGWTRARRYANHRSGRKYAGARVRAAAPDAEKAAAAEVFRVVLDRARRNRVYVRLRAAHARRASPRVTGDGSRARAGGRTTRAAAAP